MGSGARRVIESAADLATAAGKALIKVPVHTYRWTLKPLVGAECRHLPTCS
jgi:putative component of membrane protein insertase Oxa1/YidC/SpoIIIJ protein YidD